MRTVILITKNGIVLLNIWYIWKYVSFNMFDLLNEKDNDNKCITNSLLELILNAFKYLKL